MLIFASRARSEKYSPRFRKEASLYIIGKNISIRKKHFDAGCLKAAGIVHTGETMAFKEGDVIEFKKKHPCGSNKWKVLRTGSDCRLQCEGCGHQIEISRSKLDKNIR